MVRDASTVDGDKLFTHQLDQPMWIMVVYISIVAVSQLIVVAIGLALDRTRPALSLPVSLSLFFAVFWVGWILAVLRASVNSQSAQSASGSSSGARRTIRALIISKG